jgi:hypothetical protein
LLWYTNENGKFLLFKEMPWKFSEATPTHPTYDPDEYPNLAAYAYFRMMLAEIKMGRISSSQTTYNWLQSNYPSGKPGHVYAELAAVFWNDYQESHNINQGCSMTYEYANAHLEEIFRYLTKEIITNEQHLTWPNPTDFGQQSSELGYNPKMICPSK